MAEKLPTRGGMKKVQKSMAEKPKKASTKYSPAPMSAAAKKKAAAAGKAKSREFKDLPKQRASAPKPKKSANKPYKPNIYDQYENRRSFLIDTAETPADRKNLKKDLAKAKSDYVIAKKDKQSRAAGTAYNPAPMTAAAKAKAAAAGKVTGVRTKPKSTASKVVKAAKQVAGYTPAGMAVKGAKAVVKAARGGMSIKEENKKLAETMRNIGKADKKVTKKK